MRDWASTGSGLREYVGDFVVVAQYVMKLEPVELVFQIAHRLVVRHHFRVHAVLVLHDLVHDQLEVSSDLKLFDPELHGYSKAID
jgi:hypothetical protein